MPFHRDRDHARPPAGSLPGFASPPRASMSHVSGRASRSPMRLRRDCARPIDLRRYGGRVGLAMRPAPRRLARASLHGHLHPRRRRVRPCSRDEGDHHLHDGGVQRDARPRRIRADRATQLEVAVARLPRGAERILIEWRPLGAVRPAAPLREVRADRAGGVRKLARQLRQPGASRQVLRVPSFPVRRRRARAGTRAAPRVGRRASAPARFAPRPDSSPLRSRVKGRTWWHISTVPRPSSIQPPSHHLPAGR